MAPDIEENVLKGVTDDKQKYDYVVQDVHTPKLPAAGEQLSKEQKRELMEIQVGQLLQSFNRKQRRAFASKLQQTKDFESALKEAIRHGWRGQFIAPR